MPVMERPASNRPLAYFRPAVRPSHPPAEFCWHNAFLLVIFGCLMAGLFSFSTLLLITCLRA